MQTEAKRNTFKVKTPISYFRRRSSIYASSGKERSPFRSPKSSKESSNSEKGTVAQIESAIVTRITKDPDGTVAKTKSGKRGHSMWMKSLYLIA